MKLYNFILSLMRANSSKMELEYLTNEQEDVFLKACTNKTRNNITKLIQQKKNTGNIIELENLNKKYNDALKLNKKGVFLYKEKKAISRMKELLDTEENKLDNMNFQLEELNKNIYHLSNEFLDLKKKYNKRNFKVIIDEIIQKAKMFNKKLIDFKNESSPMIIKALEKEKKIIMSEYKMVVEDLDSKKIKIQQMKCKLNLLINEKRIKIEEFKEEIRKHGKRSINYYKLHSLYLNKFVNFLSEINSFEDVK